MAHVTTTVASNFGAPARTPFFFARLTARIHTRQSTRLGPLLCARSGLRSCRSATTGEVADFSHHARQRFGLFKRTPLCRGERVWLKEGHTVRQTSWTEPSHKQPPKLLICRQ